MSTLRRADRVAREIQRELSRLVQREVRDPRLSQVTFTRVELTDDLKEARVAFVPLGGTGSAERIAELQAGLDKARGWLQRKVGAGLRLRNTPRLRFGYDRGMENLVRIHEVIQGLQGPGESDSSEPAEAADGEGEA